MSNHTFVINASEVDPPFAADGAIIPNLLLPCKTVSDDYAAKVTDSAIVAGLGAAATVTLPAAGTTPGTALPGKQFLIVNSGGAALTVESAVSQINGAASITLAAGAVHAALIVSNGSGYWALVS